MRRAQLGPLLLSLSLAGIPALHAAPSIGELAFMSGCFRGDGGDGTVLEERWTPPRAGMMLGTSQYVEKGERTVFFELHRIEERDGKVVFWPQPGGKPSVGFPLVSVKDGVATFENPDHDFPRRFVYRRTAGGFAAHLEGEEGGKAKVEDYEMARFPCEEPAGAPDLKSARP